MKLCGINSKVQMAHVTVSFDPSVQKMGSQFCMRRTIFPPKGFYNLPFWNYGSEWDRQWGREMDNPIPYYGPIKGAV